MSTKELGVGEHHSGGIIVSGLDCRRVFRKSDIKAVLVAYQKASNRWFVGIHPKPAALKAGVPLVTNIQVESSTMAEVFANQIKTLCGVKSEQSDF